MKLYNGDCLEVMKDIPDNSVDLILTDPPYLIKYKTSYRKDKKHKFCHMIENDDNKTLVSAFIKKSYNLLKNNSAFYCFCNSVNIDFFKQEIEKAKFKIRNIIVWVKNNHTAGDLNYSFGRKYEFIILANKGKSKFNGKRETDVWFFDRVVGKNQLHQNQKPIKLIEQCLSKHSKENDVVLDPFMGSGTTGVACKNLDRNFIGIELDKEYFEIAKNRINEHKIQRNMF